MSSATSGREVSVPDRAAGPHLFSRLPVRGVTLRNRVAVSPMC
jgi:hypothetical protein